MHEDETDWPEGSPILTDKRDYKRDERRGFGKIWEHERADKEWENSRDSTAYRPPHVCPHSCFVNKSNVLFYHIQLRDEDSFDQRQSAAATEASRYFQSASEKRYDHNYNYIGHWPREKREGHKHAVTFAQDRSNENKTKSQKHLDVRVLTPCMIPLIWVVPQW